MVIKNQNIFDAALALPDDERTELVMQLLASLALEDPEVSDQEFAAELSRRAREMEQDPSASVPWSQLKNED